MFVYCVGCKARHNLKERDAVRLLHYAQTTAFAPPGQEPYCLKKILDFTYDGDKSGILVNMLMRMDWNTRIANTKKDLVP